MGYLFTLFAILGTITNSFGKKICFIFWLASNGYFIVVNFMNNDYPQTILFIFNTIMAVVGFVLWHKKEKKAAAAKQKEELCSNTI